jgi:hypothetical protein
MGVQIGMAVDPSVIGGPLHSAACLSCHATGHDAPAGHRAAGFRLRQGVGCEKCHGPAGDHVEAMRRQDYAQPHLGLVAAASKRDCQDCHRPQRSHQVLGRPAFDAAAAWALIRH